MLAGKVVLVSFTADDVMFVSFPLVALLSLMPVTSALLLLVSFAPVIFAFDALVLLVLLILFGGLTYPGGATRHCTPGGASHASSVALLLEEFVAFAPADDDALDALGVIDSLGVLQAAADVLEAFEASDEFDEVDASDVLHAFDGLDATLAFEVALAGRSVEQ